MHHYLLTRNGDNILEIADLANTGTIPHGLVAADIEQAIDDASAGVTRVLIRNDRLFHLFVMIPDYQESDSIALKVIEADNEVLGEGQFYPAHDMGIRGIVTTIDTLLRIPADTDNPIFPDMLESYEGIPTARLPATAMVNLSLAHSSPRPLANERNNGIFTDYIQFMDNICRTWSSAGIAGAEKGLPRLRKIHEQVLETNLGEIVDPVQVVNRGATAEYGQPVKKRKNYAFYEGYARLDCDIAVPEYAADVQPGGGVMFRVSENVELYAANHPDSANMFDEPFLQGAESSRRIIFEADDSLLSKVTIDGEGLWVKGMDPSKGEHTYYIGISPVRLPIQTATPPVEIGHPFALPAERGAPSDPVGTVIGGPERSVVRIFPLKEGPDGTQDTIRNVVSPKLLLHHEKRWVELDTNYLMAHQIEFKVLGDQQQRARITVSPAGNGAVLEDLSPGEGALGVVLKLKDKAVAYFYALLGMYRLCFKDVENKFLETVVTGNDMAEVEIAPDDELLPDDPWKGCGKIALRRTKGLKVYSSNMPEESNLLFPKTDSDESLVSEPMALDAYKGSGFLGSLTHLYLHSEQGGKEEFTVSFVQGRNEHFSETVRLTRIKPANVDFYVQGITSWSPQHRLDFSTIADTTQPVRASIEMGVSREIEEGVVSQYPTDAQIAQHLELSLSFFGGVESNYPTEVCSDIELYKESQPQGDASVIVRDGNVRVWVDPLQHLRSSPELSGMSKYSMDLHSESEQSSADADAFDNLPGIQLGKSRWKWDSKDLSSMKTLRVGGMDWLFGHGISARECISPTAYPYSGDDWSRDYAYTGGVVLATLKMNNSVLNTKRLAYPAPATYFMQSGHGIAGYIAGFMVSEYAPLPLFLELSRLDEQHSQTSHQILKAAWEFKEVVILNSCYNLNL